MIGDEYSENSTGPRTDPYGIPNKSLCFIENEFWLFVLYDSNIVFYDSNMNLAISELCQKCQSHV